MRRIAIVGTNTAVGKTWVACALARYLISQSLNVVARKPVQSYTPAVDTLDSTLLGEATGENPENVCSKQWTMPIALAPPIAANKLGRKAPTLDQLRNFSLSVPPECDVCLIELVGGVRSPIARDGDTLDLACLLEPDLTILVSQCELGTINAVRLSLSALRALNCVTYLNKFDPSNDVHQSNASYLATTGINIVTSIAALSDLVKGA